MSNKTFSMTRGIRLPKMRDDKRVDIVELEEPDFYHVPMLAQKDKEATVVVEIGSRVKKGTIIGRTPQINIFSPCSGVVKDIIVKPSMQGKLCNHVIIQNDHKKNKEYFKPVTEINRINVLKRIAEAGILDRNGNPLITTLNVPDGKVMKKIIINACTDEPYVTNNISILLNYGEKIIEAIRLISIATGIPNVIFAITKFTNEKAENFVKLLLEKHEYEKFNEIKIEAQIVQDRYPIGDEKELMYALTKNVLGVNQTSKDYGYIMIDMSVLLGLYSAVYDGKPDFERLVSLSGCNEFVTEPYWIKNGTTIDHIINHSVSKSRLNGVVKIIAGGPLRGNALSDTSVAFDKVQVSLMFLTFNEIYIERELKCIQCGKCTAICPRKLMPYKIDRALYAEDYVAAKKFGAEYCSSCGCCAYICPAKRYLVQRIDKCKKKIERKGLNKCH